MRTLLILMLVIVISAVSALAQSQSTTGNIGGHVVDANGAVVPGVAVNATNQDTGFAKRAVSDADGNYLLVLLPPGNYKVDVAAAKGFAAATYQNVKVTVGAESSLEIVLKAGTTNVVVDVSNDGQGLEAMRTSI